MINKIPLSYHQLERIKAEEYARFFANFPEYSLYMNHLGEVQWMKQDEAEKQHEFFLYSEPLLKRWNRSLGKKGLSLAKMSPIEREFRLQIRQYLEKKCLGEVSEETSHLIPLEWRHKISDEELENIPISLNGDVKKDWKKILIILLGFVLISFIIYFTFTKVQEEETGKLFIDTGEVIGRVYMDKTIFLGYTNRTLVNIPIGIHRISVKKDGFISLPASQEVQVLRDSLYTLLFKMNRNQLEGWGFLQIKSDYDDSKIFIDNILHGLLKENPVIPLEAGEHAISVEKVGYLTSPAQTNVIISTGDTSMISVQQFPLVDKRVGSYGANKQNIGSIEIFSNVNDAKIYLNGNDTGEFTDHIFTQMPLGKYIVQVKKDGYLVEPEELIFELSKNKPGKNVYFNLVKSFETIRISTKPANGAIYLNGEFKGNGKFEGTLKVGSHELSFGDVSGYKKPKKRAIQIKPGKTFLFEAIYFPEFNIYAGIDTRGSLETRDCEINSGYTFRNQSFIASDEGGPSIEFNDDFNDYAWKLGYAFPYRTPKGNDAVKCTFELPRDIDYDQEFTLKIIAASSKEKYPLSLTSKVDISVKFNNHILSYKYSPKFLEDLGKLENIEWDITQHIRGGVNVLEIMTTDENNSYYYLKRIEIFN